MGIPVAQVAISLADAEAGSIAVASPALDEYEAGLADALRAAPYVTRFPGSLDPSPFVRTLRFREPLTPVTPPPADSWGGRSGPRIYMSFGTVLGHMTIAAGVFRTALVAVERLDVRALLTVGRRFDRSVLGPVPENVRVHAWIEQCAALADADLVVCHGGSGTAFGALAAGLPVVVVPIFADQFENGRRIVKAGAGEIVDLPSAQVGARHVIREEDAPLITAAIERVITMPSYRAGAGRIAQEMAAMPTVDEVLDRLLADVA
jgi:UDP:flavonoid glycosyltransferase YjiC (YdhE family)